MDTSFPSNPTPRSLGYGMPAEWGPHRATWLSWPHNLETWPTQLARVQDIWLQMAVALSPYEQVCLLVNDFHAEREVSTRLSAAGAVMANISLLQIPTEDVWIRDYGPSFVTRNSRDQPLAANDWIFNGWGGKYKSYERDDNVAKHIIRQLKVPVFEHPVILEGGSIEVNGAGLCLTTEQCLLNRNRNPDLSREQIEQLLKNALGVNKVVWLGEGVAGDDTDGHIDDIARFVDFNTVVCVREANTRDENYAPLEENYERLLAARDSKGGKLEVVSMPSPSPLLHEGLRLPASYANFYIANEVLLAPIFGEPTDKVALGILQELFPTRKIKGLPCADVVAGLGAIHCVTQQEPQTG